METQQQGLKNAPLRGFVQDRFLVDVYKPKNGDEKDIVVLAFLVMDRITQGQFEFIDVDVSPAPDEEGNYLVFLEIKRSAAMFDLLSDILGHLGNMVDIHQWYFQPYAYQEFLDWNRENFLKTIPQSPQDHSGERSEKPAGDPSEQSGGERVEESEIHEISKQDPQPERRIPEPEHRIPDTDNQPESDVDNWNAPINSSVSNTPNRHHEKEKRHLKNQIDDLKNKMQYLYRQIDFYQEREKMFLRREDQNYNRIRELENLVMSITYSANDDPEKITRALGPMFNDDHPVDSETDTTDREAASFFAAGKQKPVEDLAKEYYALGTEAAELKSYQVTELIPTAKRGYVKLAVLHYQLKEFEDSHTNALQAMKLGSKSAQKILGKIKAKIGTQSAAAAGAGHLSNPENAGEKGSHKEHKLPEKSKKTRK
jgi:hypothetical protein